MGPISEFGTYPKLVPGGPKLPQKGPELAKVLQNDSKNSFVGSDGSKRFELPGKQLKQYGSIQPDLFEPMTGVGCLQH